MGYLRLFRAAGEGKIIIMTPSGNLESATIFPGNAGELLVAFVSSAAFRGLSWGGGGSPACMGEDG